MASNAPRRPVSSERQNLTAADLKAKGSTIVEATDSIKGSVTTAGAALAGASGVASQINEAANNVQNIKDAAQNGQDGLSFLAQNWQFIVIGILLLVVAFCIWKMWHMANLIENERVNAARKGEFVKI